MKAGDLRERVTLQTKSTSRDSFGSQRETWSDFKTVWAKIEPVQGDEKFLASKQFEQITNVVTIRYLKGVNSQMRAVWKKADGTVVNFDIRNVLDVVQPNGTRNRELQMRCREQV